MKTDIKQWTLSIVETSRNEFKTFIASIPERERKMTGKLKAWSAKDEVAHLGYWLEVFAHNIKVRRTGKPLVDTSDYLAMNDSAWQERKDWTWAKVKETLDKAVAEIETQIRAFSVEELTDAQSFTLEPERSSPRPFLKSLLYELIDHPLHHFVKLYQKLGDPSRTIEMLTRVQTVVREPGVSNWTATSRNKILKYRNRLPS